MGRLVMKFGGTSVADIERIRNVARHVKREVDAGHEVAVVVSAMAGTTNRLVEWCREASALHDARETTRWSPPASRSRPGCSPSCCSRSASMPARGRAGNCP
jgi:aspartokinase